jgi:hypothetical protein
VLTLKREPVPSHSLRSIGYDKATNALEVEFRNGGVYQYFAVPASTYAALMASESIGAFINQRIKPRHRCVEVYED